MTDEDPPRSLAARAAAELALVRVASHYGGRPEFVLLGGLVPALLCARSGTRHAGTTDVDVQVDLEISAGSVNAARLEQALRKAGFRPDGQYIWRWRSSDGQQSATVRFELLADIDTQRAGEAIKFANCDDLGAANLRGTGFAARDREVRTIVADEHGVQRRAEIYVTGLAGFLLAKTAAAYSRRKPKDWYDIAFVLLNNDYGDPAAAAERVWQVFGASIASAESALRDLDATSPGQAHRERAPMSTRSHLITLTLTPSLQAETRLPIGFGSGVSSCGAHRRTPPGLAVQELSAASTGPGTAFLTTPALSATSASPGRWSLRAYSATVTWRLSKAT